MRREPFALASILRKSRHGVRLNEHLEHPDGAEVFQHASQMGLEGIVVQAARVRATDQAARRTG